MLGIAHHSPWMISVFLDRNQFRELVVTEDDISSGQWGQAVEDFVGMPSDGRQRVMFVETVEGLRTLVRNGFDGSAIKVVVYDTEETLVVLPDIDLVDHKDGQAIRLDLNALNDALRVTQPGVGALTVEPPPKPVKPIVIDPVVPKPEPPKPVDPVPTAPSVVTLEPEVPAASVAPEPPVAPSPEKPRRKPRTRRSREPESYELF